LDFGKNKQQQQQPIKKKKNDKDGGLGRKENVYHATTDSNIRFPVNFVALSDLSHIGLDRTSSSFPFSVIFR